ncbi:hypothetical protein TARUN_5635 [Trichoderma arundinaceum]|uniref:Amidoligase enzyme n=1 Tax=Trichoderma arundinaceum TaxID=490622 RepID=A0A395NKT6_TRIAR|nr:hypothetical protein TARUN_5635 [Trichoderma arundinaceum]
MSGSHSKKALRPRLEIITFGWELEMLVYPKEGEPIGDDQAPKRLHQLASSIAAQAPDLPVAGQCLHSPEKTCDVCKDACRDFLLHGLRVFTPANPVFDHEGVSEYLYFYIMHEWVTTPYSTTGQRLAQPFEIASPILDNKELEAGFPQTAQIVSALRNSDLKITAHTGCGLHFHVGVKSGMTLNIAKKISTLVMLLELPLFTVLCPPQRVANHYFDPLVKSSWFAVNANAENYNTFTEKASKELLEHFPISLSQLEPAGWNDENPHRWYITLIYLWRAENMCQLASGLRTTLGEKSSLVLCVRDHCGILEETIPPDECPDSFELTPSTLEFRYPPMSFDIEYIKNWAQILCKMVKIATLDSPDFSQAVAALHRELQKDDKGADLPTWTRLLTVLGLSDQIGYWKQQLPRFAADEPIRFLDKDGFVLPDNA